MPSYKFRNLPCNILPESEIWCVTGSHESEDGSSGGGILEWCYNQGDALYLVSKMEDDPTFHDLRAHKYVPDPVPSCPDCFRSDKVKRPVDPEEVYWLCHRCTTSFLE